MSNKSDKIKFWNKDEEEQLVDEINNLMDITEILKNHDRKITGILMRIEKIIGDPDKSKKINNHNQVILKYLQSSKLKYTVNYNELYANILKYNSLEEISNDHNKVSIPKVKIILNNFLKKNDIDSSKMLRIKCLLKSEDDLDCAEKLCVDQVNNKIDTNISISKSENNIVSIMLSLIGEIKSMKTDVFDIKNRVKIIMDKVSKIEKNLLPISKINKSVSGLTELDNVLTKPDNVLTKPDDILTKPGDSGNKNNLVIDNFENDDDFDKLHEEIGEIKEINKLYKSNKLEKADKKVNINKKVQKIILSKNNDISNNSKITIGTEPKMKNDEISDYCDEEELEKEFQKYFN